jgi:pimeloyl-ACP methyl ester carboxylesterase
MRLRIRAASAAVGALFLLAASAASACTDAVVLVHGNTGKPSDFDNTAAALVARGVPSNRIFRPDWGSKLCAACNDHSGSEEAPVERALVDAAALSCTGKVDVIGHSMGVTLAARVIRRLGMSGYVDGFVGVAGAFRGLRSCGTYPFNVATTTCGYWGLSLGSPLIDSLAGQRFGARMYSIKSWSDQVVCATGICTVGGVHSSQISGEAASYTFALGHFGLLTNTASTQADLVR